MQARSSDLSTIARLIAISGGNPIQAAFLAESTKAGEAVRSVLRAAADAGSTTDPSFAAALADSGVVSTFLEAIRSRSVFARLLLDGGFVRMPLRTTAAILLADASGFVVGEGGAIPMSALSLAGATLEQRRAAALVVMSAELLRSVSPAARALVDNSLRSAVASAIDARFLSLIADGITPTPSSGTTAANALADLRAMLSTVNVVGNASLLWVMSVGTANAAATLTGATGNLVFEGMSPLGGELLGIPAMATSALPAGTLLLADASGIAGDIESIMVGISQEAAIQFSATPDSPPLATTAVQSLWQSNRSAILATAYFGAERLRDSAVAVLTDVEWGTA